MFIFVLTDEDNEADGTPQASVKETPASNDSGIIAECYWARMHS